jgi:hypothetical protein
VVEMRRARSHIDRYPANAPIPAGADPDQDAESRVTGPR